MTGRGVQADSTRRRTVADRWRALFHLEFHVSIGNAGGPTSPPWFLRITRLHVIFSLAEGSTGRASCDHTGVGPTRRAAYRFHSAGRGCTLALGCGQVRGGCDSKSVSGRICRSGGSRVSTDGRVGPAPDSTCHRCADACAATGDRGGRLRILLAAASGCRIDASITSNRRLRRIE